MQGGTLNSYTKGCNVLPGLTARYHFRALANVILSRSNNTAPPSAAAIRSMETIPFIHRPWHTVLQQMPVYPYARPTDRYVVPGRGRCLL